MSDERNNTGNWNTGNRNTGDSNTGDWNTGDYNTGSWNTGNLNTGHSNTGDWNTGNRNTGTCNTGSRNTGNWNAASFHTGFFNTKRAQKAYYFNRLLDVSEWESAEKPDWIYRLQPTSWVTAEKMTDEEKAKHPEHETTGGYLRVNDMKAEWAAAYADATPEDIDLTKALPGFDAEVFLEITGVDLREKPKAAPCEGREVEIDGVTYVLKAKE